MHTALCKPLLILFSLSLFAACGDDDGPAGATDAGPGDGGGGTDGPTIPDEPATRFVLDAENTSMPGSGLTDGFFAPEQFASFRYWTFMDLDGDGHRDIVHTGDSAASQAVWDAAGQPYWKWYAGDGDVFADSAEWPVPDSALNDGFFAAEVTGAGREWLTFDLDGDGRADLVHTQDPATGDVWDVDGAPHWKVYKNNGLSFEITAIRWSVPDSGTVSGFNKVVSTTGALNWATIDLDGDGLPDLVQSADPSTGSVWDEAGSPHWKLFENTGNGFELVPTLFSVPTTGLSSGFEYVNDVSNRWVTTDLDGDGLLDLVQTMDPNTGRVWDTASAPHWKAYYGGSGGFEATPAQWTVPESGRTLGFATANSQTSFEHWTLIDLNGDGLRDLVHTGDVAHTSRVWDATGSPYWKFYQNDGNGFSTELHRWPVPRSGTTPGFFASRSESGSSQWVTVDADNDGYVDLINTSDPATSRVWDAQGSPYWKVFRGQP